MKTWHPIARLLCFVMTAHPLVLAQNANDGYELNQLRSMVMSQQKALAEMQAQIQALRSEVAEQNKKLASFGDGGTGLARRAHAADFAQVAITGRSDANQLQAEGARATASEPPQTPDPQQQKAVGQELQRGPEIADITPEHPL